MTLWFTQCTDAAAQRPHPTTGVLVGGLSCLVSTDDFAGEYVYYLHQPIVLAHAGAPALGRLGFAMKTASACRKIMWGLPVFTGGQQSKAMLGWASAAT
jgi:hypothetical protein